MFAEIVTSRSAPARARERATSGNSTSKQVMTPNLIPSRSTTSNSSPATKAPRSSPKRWVLR